MTILDMVLETLSTFSFGAYFQNKYLFALAVIIFFALAAKLLLFIFNRYLQRFAAKTKTKFDDIIFDHTKRPLFYLILAYGFKVAVVHLGLIGVTFKVVNSVMAAVFLLVIMRVVDIIIDTWGFTIAKKTKTKVDEVVLPLFHKVGRVVYVIIVLLWILRIWDIDITPYLAGVGISGLILGLALQDSLKNVFGGVSLLLDKTYQIGDKIKLESGEVGVINDIGLRSTKLVTYDNEAIFVPNGYLANSRVLNYTRPTPSVKVTILFGVEYGTKVEKVKDVILTVLGKMEEVQKEPEPVVQFLEMGDFALKFRAQFWVDHWDKAFGKKVEATEKIYNALNKAKIGIPFPTQTVHLKKE
ncbi:mechanosensitive ion channel family protein [Candidatus Woesearchaeota archaeon]|nr:mechanosensitive ion channel family protein [Candidatus Woesearchaeota archaeon]